MSPEGPGSLSDEMQKPTSEAKLSRASRVVLPTAIRVLFSNFAKALTCRPWITTTSCQKRSQEMKSGFATIAASILHCLPGPLAQATACAADALGHVPHRTGIGRNRTTPKNADLCVSDVCPKMQP